MASSILCTGTGWCLPHPNLPWANLDPGFKSGHSHPWFHRRWPASRCFRPSLSQEPSSLYGLAPPSPPSKGPLTLPFPAESVALQAEQLRQARQGSRKTLGQGQTHLRDDLGSSLYLSFPSVMHLWYRGLGAAVLWPFLLSSCLRLFGGNGALGRAQPGATLSPGLTGRWLASMRPLSQRPPASQSQAAPPGPCAGVVYDGW